MKGVYAYLGQDGIAHFWDAANRGGEPVCGDQVFPITGDTAGPEVPTCSTCEQTVRDIVTAMVTEEQAREDVATAMRLDAWQERDLEREEQHAAERYAELDWKTDEDRDILEGNIPEDWRTS